jgi:hypothetical protein
MRTLLMVLAMVALVGCSKKKPADKCGDWLNKICGRGVSCKVIADVNSCKMAVGIDCSKTKSVSATYDQCMKDLDVGCDVLFAGGDLNLPTSCNEVILQ